MEKIFSKRDTNIVKGVAIIIMLLHHCFLSADRFDKYSISFFPFNEETIILMAKSGKCCVGIFTFLSAYGLTRSYIKQRKECGTLSESKMAEKFVLRRCINLLSGFLVVYVIAFVGSCFFTNLTPLKIYCEEQKDAFTFLYHMFLDMLGISRLLNTPALINTWWYMGLALTVIFIFPVMMKLYGHFGRILIPAYFCLFCALQLDKGNYSRWMVLVPIGIWFADHNILEKCKAWKNSKKSRFSVMVKFIVISAIMLLSATVFAWNYNTKNYSTILLDVLLTLCTVLWVYLFLADLPFISRILEFLGIHSMNIFLIHSFLRGRWLQAHIYSFRHFVLIVLVLLVESTLISIGIELLKKYSGYNNLVRKLQCVWRV